MKFVGAEEVGKASGAAGFGVECDDIFHFGCGEIEVEIGGLLEKVANGGEDVFATFGEGVFHFVFGRKFFIRIAFLHDIEEEVDRVDQFGGEVVGVFVGEESGDGFGE